MLKRYRTTEGKIFTFEVISLNTGRCKEYGGIALLYDKGFHFVDNYLGTPRGLVMAEDVTQSSIRLEALVSDKINEIFLEYQNAHNIESGDIAPLDQLKLMQIEESLVSLIKSIYEKEVK